MHQRVSGSTTGLANYRRILYISAPRAWILECQMNAYHDCDQYYIKYDDEHPMPQCCCIGGIHNGYLQGNGKYCTNYKVKHFPAQFEPPILVCPALSVMSDGVDPHILTSWANAMGCDNGKNCAHDSTTNNASGTPSFRTDNSTDGGRNTHAAHKSGCLFRVV